MAILNFLSMGLGLSNCTIPTNEGAPAVGINTQGPSAVLGRNIGLPAAALGIKVGESSLLGGFLRGMFPREPGGILVRSFAEAAPHAAGQRDTRFAVFVP